MNMDKISAAKYAKAINAVDSKLGHALLREHLAFHNQGVHPTREQLAKKVGINGGCAANLHYGRFAHAIGEQLGFTDAPLYLGKPYWMLVLEYEPTERGAKGHTAYELRPKIVEALTA